jgi:type I restriction enzyme R subunit
LLRLKDVTVELVDLLAQGLQSNRGIWSPSKRAAQDDLNTQLFEHLMRLRPPWWIPTKRACWQTS